jgi:hypothetical protein
VRWAHLICLNSILLMRLEVVWTSVTTADEVGFVMAGRPSGVTVHIGAPSWTLPHLMFSTCLHLLRDLYSALLTCACMANGIHKAHGSMHLIFHIVDSECVFLVVKVWTVIWVMASCNLLGGYHLFRGTYCFHLQGRWRTRNSPMWHEFFLSV